MALPAAAFVVPTLVAAGMSYLGQQSANDANITNAREASKSNIQSAREQMQFQERMSNTAYQRATADMSKAGINPMLAYAQGGASTPSGAAGSSIPGHVENAITPALSSALEVRRLKKELDATDSQIGVNSAIQATQAADAELKKTNAKMAAKEIEALDSQMPAIKQKGKVDLERAKYDEKFMKFDSYGKRIRELLGGVSDAASVIRPKYSVPRIKNKETIIDKNTGEVLHERLR